MKSPIYILSCLLPLAAQIAQASPTPEDAEDAVQFEERGDPNTQGRDVCRLHRGDHFFFYKFPCGDSPIIGRANQGDFVNFDCRYKWVPDTKLCNNKQYTKHSAGTGMAPEKDGFVAGTSRATAVSACL